LRFNSFSFLLIFLPVALLIYQLAERAGFGRVTLLALSFAFYSYWDWLFAPLLAVSILANWALAELFLASKWRAVVAAGIALNLLALAAFKYSGFLANVTGLPVALQIALPLGISFFTFHHIMYLSDLRAGLAPRYDLVRYGLYISFFPQILAGPLVRWSEVMHQFDATPPHRAEMFARGLCLMIVGLGKKVLIGDTLAIPANTLFAAAERTTLSFVDAWLGVLAFTFQIYFDFSGYTDMAIGIAMMFGIVLPQNFNAPYRATSLQDFWRRWHMTLSRFLRDYLYIPLGGNRNGLAVQLFAVIATMTIGGLWHGAGLTFVAWGAAHGVGLTAGVLWRRSGLTLPPLIAWPLTFAFVAATWVLFRAETFDAAQRTITSLLRAYSPGQHKIGDPLFWPFIAASACLAIFGPTSWSIISSIRPAPGYALAAAAALTLSFAAMSYGEVRQFIYFQF
jgi:D-alanyl-lipoteichoic acid acyltransferase DltB (MBOAT superfamily)